MPTIPPTIDGVLLPWSSNFLAKISLTPSVYSLTASDATAYGALHSDYEARLAVVDVPATRTKVTQAEKRASKAALLAKSRQFCKIIKAVVTVTDAQLIALGMSARDVTPTPVPAPVERPVLTADPFGNLTVRVEGSDRKGKPSTTIGAVVYAAILPAGTPPPATPDEAKFVGLATRDKFAVPLPEDAGGKFLHVMAQYFNGKGQAGPVSAVASMRIAA